MSISMPMKYVILIGTDDENDESSYIKVIKDVINEVLGTVIKYVESSQEITIFFLEPNQTKRIPNQTIRVSFDMPNIVYPAEVITTIAQTITEDLYTKNLSGKVFISMENGIATEYTRSQRNLP